MGQEPDDSTITLKRAVFGLIRELKRNPTYEEIVARMKEEEAKLVAEWEKANEIGTDQRTRDSSL